MRQYWRCAHQSTSGDTTEVKNGGSLSSAQGRRKAQGSSGERGKGGSEGGVCLSPFIGAEGAPGRGGRGSNVRC
jgi:hypothetical protein